MEDASLWCYLRLVLRNQAIPIIKISTTPPPMRQYNIPPENGLSDVEITVVVGSRDEIGEIRVASVGKSVPVKTGTVPLPDSPVDVGTMLGPEIMLSTVGLVVKSGV
jgi:hypothetical protein